MEKIKGMLGLWVHNQKVMDRFDWAFMAALGLVKKKLNSPEGICVEEELDSLECRKKKLDSREGKTYREALILLAKIRPEYKKYLPKASKAGRKRKVPRDLSDLLKRRIRLAVWTGTGNKIPDRELNVAKVANLLKEKGYGYRRKSGEMGWRRGSQFVGEDLFRALEHLEKNKAVDRKSLTISF